MKQMRPKSLFETFLLNAVTKHLTEAVGLHWEEVTQRDFAIN